MDALNERTVLLIGEHALARLRGSLVVVAGLGGVGGICAEALARSGVGRLLLIDMDMVAESNRNRQTVALKSTLGMKKTDAMRARLLDASDAAVETLFCRITSENAAACIPADADFIVDAIDDVPAKLALILAAREKSVPILSCMGAGGRLDPTAFSVVDIYATDGCPLARKMRHELRRAGVSSLPAVFSSEPSAPRAAGAAIGSLAPATGAAGLTAAGYVIQELMKGAVV